MMDFLSDVSMADQLQISLADMLDSLADLFETRALIAGTRCELERQKAYDEAARHTRQLVEKLRE